MRNIFCILFSFLILLYSCDTESEPTHNGYTEWKSAFYPNSISSQYKVLFNGSESHYVPIGQTTGTLEVYEKESNRLILTVNNAKMENGGFSFVKALGSELELYEKGKYITFTPNIIYTIGKEADYLLRFNDIEIQNNSSNYIRSEELNNSNLSIIRKKDNKTIAKIHLNKDLETLSLFQVNDTFVTISENPETPLKGNTYVRFFYLTKDFPNIDSLQIDLYAANEFLTEFNTEKTASIKLKAGEISNYVLINWNNTLENGDPVAVMDYDLINPEEPDIKITDHNSNYGDTKIIKSLNYKFATFQILPADPSKNVSSSLEANTVLSIFW